MSEIESEIERLNGELFAYRAMLFYFLQRFAPHGPTIVRQAFDDAANHAEDATIRFGKKASPLHLAKALEIIEDFRSQIVPEQGKSGPFPPTP
ncbi:hypothetical protein [Bradyrhizobium retamae]|uniref:Uncharacterized protein n=1 Tax=Bradyrhizobium retamae TaxID=1300035 RepID=A0A0R3MQD8_9BRAD|nr:hypothetical protein [Bradyrhizobium retamae]KRR21916.1 hypothetical protein CQ13_07725 [Bradyrhizobium retamae]